MRKASLRIPKLSHENSKRSEEHTSELQSQSNLVCRLLLEKKKKKKASKLTRIVKTTTTGDTPGSWLLRETRTNCASYRTSEVDRVVTDLAHTGTTRCTRL